MSSERVRADNYEQLIEIVKAVQRGESLSGKPLSGQTADRGKAPDEAAGEELSNLESREEPSGRGVWEEPPGREAAEGEGPESRDVRKEHPSAEKPGRKSFWKAGLEKRRAGKKDQEDEFWEDDLWEDELSGQRAPKKKSGSFRGLPFLKRISAGRKPEDEGGAEEPAAEGAAEASREEERSPEERQADEQALSRLFHGKFLPDAEPLSKGPDEEKAGEKAAEAPETGDGSAPEKEEQKKAEASAPPDGGSAPSAESASGVRGGLHALTGKLAQKGFHRRELTFAGLGLLLAVFVVCAVVRAVSVSNAEKRKMEHVTADEGLTVLVEKEPERWCSSFPVELTVRAGNEQLQKASVNGTSYMLDEDGRLTAEADTPLLEVEVDTEQGTLRAQVEIPMIDTQPPAVSVERQQDQIIVTAADARSEVTKIRYAALHSSPFYNVPLYQDYSGPITFEEDCVYRFYAQDAAGNRCSPLVSTMEKADTFSLPCEELSLFPQESVYLEARAEPEGALLNNLKYTSADPNVVVVDGAGRVTAVALGSTVVTASADEVGEVSCRVTVSEERTVTISAIGDCTLGTDDAFNSETSFVAFDIVNGHSWFFQNVRDILEGDDVTFANLEGTFTTSSQREAKEYAFKGDPSYTKILEDGSVEVVTLANNHSGDYGEQGLADTKQYLTEAGIDYCIENEIVLREVNGIQAAFIGIYVLDDGMESETQLREAIAEAQEQGAQLIVVAFHWGSEKATAPDETQQALAHIAVDCGANLVVGHHPHVLQGIEKYKGAYIAYSLGNFCFGGNSAPSDMDTMIFRQTFKVTRDSVLDDDQVEIIPCSISSTAYYNDYRPTPAQGTDAERIIGRINEYSAPFGMTYTASDGLS